MSIVAGTVLWALVLHLGFAMLWRSQSPKEGGREVLPQDPALGAFQFTDQAGRPFGAAELEDRVWVAAFIFTRCPSSCPRITATMRGLQDRLKDTGVHLVSISVDPEHDTPEVLARYAQANGAEPGRWHYLTAPRDVSYPFIRERFHLGLAEATKEAIDRGSEAIIHSDRLVLVDRGNRVVNYYSSADEESHRIDDLIQRARQLDAANWVRSLPAVNATLNGSCLVLLLLGWAGIRSARTRAHIGCMVAALAVAAAFLSCYLVYHAQVGSVPFRGLGLTRTVYFTVLLSHTVLAAAMVPMIAITLVRAVRKRFDSHVRLARVTLPIWLYVSLTGVLIYVMLYRLPVAG